MRIRLFAVAFVALLVSGIPAPAFAAAIFDPPTNSFTLSVGESTLDPSVPLPPSVTSGTKTSVDVRNTYTGGGYTFTIGPKGTSAPVIFGVDSTLDSTGFQNAVIKYVSGPTSTADLTIEYDFSFGSVTSNSQTYAIYMGGGFSRGFGTATGDTIGLSGEVVFPDFSCGEFTPCFNSIATPLSYAVGSNSFVLPSATENVLCSVTSGVTTCGTSYTDTIDKTATVHFTKGDSLTLTASLIAVRCPNDGPDAQPDCPTLVEDFLAAKALEDAAELGLPEPSSLLLLGAALAAGLGLSRLMPVRGRAGQDPRD